MLFFVAALMPFLVRAATLSLSPASGSFTVGSFVALSVYVSSPDEAVNAVSGTLLFSTDIMEVASVTKNGSIVDFWIQEPSTSASRGEINFEGIMLNPGFNDTRGKVLTITFRVKKAGSATVKFSSGKVLANDGAGTDVLTGLGNASFSFSPAKAVDGKKDNTASLASSTQQEISDKGTIDNQEISTSSTDSAEPTKDNTAPSKIDNLVPRLLFLLLIVVLVVFWMREFYHLKGERRELSNKVRSTGRVFQNTYATLRKVIEEQLDSLTKKPEKTKNDLEEEFSLHQLESTLDEAEESIQKEMHDAENDL